MAMSVRDSLDCLDVGIQLSTEQVSSISLDVMWLGIFSSHCCELPCNDELWPGVVSQSKLYLLNFLLPRYVITTRETKLGAAPQKLLYT